MNAHPSVLDLIPHRPPFLFVDEIVSRTTDGLVAKRTLRPEEDFYKGHYPNAPITPGVLLCEAVFQTAALYLALELKGTGGDTQGVPLLAKINEVRFRNPVFPGESILIEVKKKDMLGGFYMMSGHIKSGDKRVLTVDFSVAWKTPEGQPAAQP